MRSVALFLVMALPLALRAQSVAGQGGVQVKGWKARLDPQAERRGAKVSDVSWREDGGAYVVEAGAPAVYWNPASVARGSYRAGATFAEAKVAASRAHYGVFIGGSRLDTPGQNYLYCALAGSGTFVVRHRIGDELHELAGRTAHRAIHGGAAGGPVVNEVSWQVTPARTSCLVNGTEVWGYPSAALVGEGRLESLDGVAGLRVEQGLTLRITGFAIAGGAAR